MGGGKWPVFPPITSHSYGHGAPKHLVVVGPGAPKHLTIVGPGAPIHLIQGGIDLLNTNTLT